MYLDCRLMVLKTNAYIAKENVILGVKKTGSCVSSKIDGAKNVVTDKVKTGVKTGVDKVKEVKIFKKKAEAAETKAETNNEEKVEETEDFREVKPEPEMEKKETVVPETESVNTEETVNMDFSEVTVGDEENTHTPDFTPLNGVYYDPDPAVGNFVKTDEPSVNPYLDEKNKQQITQEEADALAAKMKGDTPK